MVGKLIGIDTEISDMTYKQAKAIFPYAGDTVWVKIVLKKNEYLQSIVCEAYRRGKYDIIVQGPVHWGVNEFEISIRDIHSITEILPRSVSASWGKQ